MSTLPPFELGRPRTELRRLLVDEGEGYASVDEWRVAHLHFFGRPIDPETQIVATRFRVVERL